MRILFILHTPPPVHGSSMVGQFIKDCQTINETYDCSYINLGTSTTINEIGKNPLRKIVRYLSILGNLLKQLIRFKPQLCYLAITAKGLAFYKDALIALIVKLFGVKLVLHFHNKGVITRQHLFFDNLIYGFVFKNTDVILLSRYLYYDIQKYVSEKRVFYCPNGIPEFEVIRQKTSNKGQNEMVKILYLSNLIESKGVFVLLNVCKLMQEKRLPFHCTFVGGEGDITEAQFQKIVTKLGLEDIVVYAGRKYKLEKAEIFMQSEIFVHPTFNDCFPLVLLEAMQFSLPVVSTYEGGIPDIIDNGINGFLVSQKDVSALAEKLEVLIRKPELRQQMGLAGKIKFEKEFTLKKFENNIQIILNQLICENN